MVLLRRIHHPKDVFKAKFRKAAKPTRKMCYLSNCIMTDEINRCTIHRNIKNQQGANKLFELRGWMRAEVLKHRNIILKKNNIAMDTFFNLYEIYRIAKSVCSSLTISQLKAILIHSDWFWRVLGWNSIGINAKMH